MNHLEEIFFTLLRSAIWGNEPVLQRVVSDEEWDEIYAISKEQTVSGIMLDAVAKLPEEKKPGTKLRLKWIILQKSIEAQNKKMNGALLALLAEMKGHSIEPYLLKGQGVAQNYPLPAHRICGDIDIYFTPQYFEQAISFFTSKGCEIEGNAKDSHCETSYMDFKVEIHRKSATFYTKRLQRRYDEIVDSLLAEGKSFVEIDGCKVEVFPHMANAMQMLSHMLRHIIFSGLGLRQICDWVLFVNKYWAEIDKEKFVEYAKELQLWETYKAVTAIAIDYLGLPAEYTIGEINRREIKNAKKVLCLVMQYGNFGHYGEHSIVGTRKERFNAYMWKVKNCIRFRKLAKSEAWNYPIWQLHSITNIIKR